MIENLMHLLREHQERVRYEGRHRAMGPRHRSYVTGSFFVTG